ncbi:ribose-phosphate pyrophosphokinase [Panacagrimonas perspica]|uniref:Ribose-phosphate pyrophosphokinase n=1 Tax=Panacagrimonas perspica TaxID=381431 RepID=A0A4R7PCB3_9GAMM|nr:ribose-phosphate diphosphokinase [Panacagrimonas perspica]TDU31658.1 ribose-phosphate pyrophosphokinase [Panacagrimonas perspica]THD03121.1 hypothetical protein B1810_11060 [Panacagrimonas perspica]
MTAVIFGVPGNEALVEALCLHAGVERGECVFRAFADGETYVRFLSPVLHKTVVVACTLDRPDDKLVKLFLAARTLHDMGAARVLLVAPYLPYMRQDTVFAQGEGISARHVASLLSSCFDGLVTVDPHLHRIPLLEQVYPIPIRVVPAAPAIARWIRSEVLDPLLIGPDAESEQWVSAIATLVDCPYRMLTKHRYGDRDVTVEANALQVGAGHRAVLVDDIVATGRTQAAAIALLQRHGHPAPVCICVHGLFAGDAWSVVTEAGARTIVSCNTVTHASNRIDVLQDVATAVSELLATAH